MRELVIMFAALIGVFIGLVIVWLNREDK